MKSRTKNHLSEEKIKELVRIHFGSSCEIGAITELKGGMFNAIYRIQRIREKDGLILKVGVAPGTKKSWGRKMWTGSVRKWPDIWPSSIISMGITLGISLRKKAGNTKRGKWLFSACFPRSLRTAVPME